MADGMNWAIFTLGVVIATVLGAFGTFLIYVIRKSEALEAAKAGQASRLPGSPSPRASKGALETVSPQPARL